MNVASSPEDGQNPRTTSGDVLNAFGIPTETSQECVSTKASGTWLVTWTGVSVTEATSEHPLEEEPEPESSQLEGSNKGVDFCSMGSSSDKTSCLE